MLSTRAITASTPITAAVMALIATTALLLHLGANRADARRGIVSSAAR